MNTHLHKLSEKTKRVITLVLIVVLGVSSVSAGLLFTPGKGITSTTGGGITYAGAGGVLATALDSLLALTNNGITAPITSAIATGGVDFITAPGGLLNLLLTGVDKTTTGQASEITATN